MNIMTYIFAAVGLYVVAGMIFTIINAIILQRLCDRSKVANENLARFVRIAGEAIIHLSELIKEERKRKEWKRDLDWINHRK